MSEGAAPSPVTIEELLEHGRWVRRLATSLVVGEEAAEELTQASMVQAISHPPRYRGNLRSWLATLTRNLARDRSSDRSRLKDPRFLEAVRRDHPIESSDQIVARIETQRLVSEVLLGLAPRLREVLVLRFYDELSYREIGERLGIPADTARSRIIRGLAELRAELDLRGGENAIDWRMGMALWIGAGDWSKLGTGAGGGLLAWVRGVSALQAVSMLTLTGLLAMLWWAPWTATPPHARPAVSSDREGNPVPPTVQRAEVATGARREVVGVAQEVDPNELVSNHGRVIHRVDGAPVMGARVRLSRRSPSGAWSAIATTTDADGRFQFNGFMQPFEFGPAQLMTRFDGDGVLRIETEVGLAALEEILSSRALTGDPHDLLPWDADLGDFALTPTIASNTRLIGDWEPEGSLWVGELIPGESPPQRWRQVAKWDENRVLTWRDQLGAYTHRSARRVLLAFDGKSIGWLEPDLPLHAVEVSELVFHRAPLARVEVRLQDARGRPVTGVPVIASPRWWPLRSPGERDYCLHAELPRPTGFDALRRSVTDSNGIAVFEHLPAGFSDLRSEAGEAIAEECTLGDLSASGTYVFCAGSYHSKDQPHRSSSPTRLVAGSTNVVEMLYDSAQRVDLAGVVTDESGAPLAGVLVRASDHLYTNAVMGNQGVAQSIDCATDAMGRFVLNGVDRSGQGVERIGIDGSKLGLATRRFDFEIPTTGRDDLTFVLPREHRLRGRLVDQDGQGVFHPGIKLLVRPAQFDRFHPLPTIERSLELKSDGTFEADGIIAARMMVYPFGFEDAGLVPFEPQFFEAQDDLDVELLLQVESLDRHATRVEWTVADRESAAPIGIATAHAFSLEAGRRAPIIVSARPGVGVDQVIWEALPPGKWRIELRLHGGRRLWRSLSIDGSSSRLTDVVYLPSPGIVEGSLDLEAVATELANPVVTARLVDLQWIDAGPDVESRFGAVGEQAKVDGEGRFRFTGLTPGRYELRFEAPGWAALGWAEVAADRTTEVEVEVQPGRELTLRGDPRPFFAQGLQLHFSVRGADGCWTSWPFALVEGEVRAVLPADALAWEARWWTTGIAERQAAVALEGRTTGTCGADERLPIEGVLPD